jgi:hypothetical protein
VFSLPKPNDGTTYGAQSLDAQQSIVLKLLAIKVPESASDSALLNAVLGFESKELFNSVLKTLHKNTDIKIFSDHL